MATKRMTVHIYDPRAETVRGPINWRNTGNIPPIDVATREGKQLADYLHANLPSDSINAFVERFDELRGR